MIVDLVCALLFLLFGYLGYRSGFLVQLFRVASLVAGFAAAYYVAEPLGTRITLFLSSDPFITLVVTYIGVFFLASLLVGLVGAAIVKKAGDGGVTFKFLNRGLGGVLGAAKGLLVIYVGVALLLILSPVIQRSQPGFSLDPDSSVVASKVARSNILQDAVFPRATALFNLVRLVEDPDALAQAMVDLKFQAVVSHADAKFLEDADLAKAAPDERWKILAEEGRLFELLEDDGVVEALNDLDVDAYCEAADAEKARRREAQEKVDVPKVHEGEGGAKSGPASEPAK